jgi:methionyl-tRNA formyltransferase
VKPKIIFFGNSGSKFSNGLFKHFLNAECQLIAVVDTPIKDRQTTSGSTDLLADFVSLAKERGIPGFEPDSPNTDEFVGILKAYEPDAIVLAGYSKLIKQDLLQISAVASINFHASLLPEYRGRHPIFWAIRKGETLTGITAHHLSAKLDEGNIAFQKAVPITDNDSVEQVYDKVIKISKDVVNDLCQALKNGSVPDIRQRDGGAYYSYIKPDDWIISFSMPTKQIKDMVRATPGKCWFNYDGEKLFALKTRETEAGLVIETIDGKEVIIKYGCE